MTDSVATKHAKDTKALAITEAAVYDKCEAAVEPVDASRPFTHEGTAARKRAYREGRLVSARQAEIAKVKADAAAEAKRIAEAEAVAVPAPESPQAASETTEPVVDADEVEVDEADAETTDDEPVPNDAEPTPTDDTEVESELME